MSEQVAAAANSMPGYKLPLQITIATLNRLVVNTSRRFVYPFAPALSRGLGVPLTSITSLIAINQFTGLLSPLFGPLSDRWGYRFMMMAGLGMLAIGMLTGGFLPYYAAILVALFLAGVGKGIFDPALQAYVGEKVPYHRRGRVIGLIETSWAGASLIGIPVMGVLIDRWGWRSPFFMLGGVALLGVVALGVAIPKENRQQIQTIRVNGLWQAWQALHKQRTAVGMLAFGFFISVANDNLFVVYGAWLEGSFALGLVALGTATTVIGLAELSGEALTATLSDRIGLKRAAIMGLLLSTFSYLLLPFIGQTLSLALGGLFIIFIAFEFTIVTSFSLVTEVLPNARATMTSSFVAATGLGRVAGALIGGPVWLSGGLLATGLISAGLSIAAMIFLLWGLRNWQA